MNDNIIYETDNFTVCMPGKPHIPREDGGHLIISSKNKQYSSRCDLSPREAMELMRLTMLTGEAMKAGLKSRGIELIRINYQENGNWAHKSNRLPVLHVHLYGRTADSKTQKWPEALVFPAKETGFYEGFEPLNEEDAGEIIKQIKILENSDKYRLSSWML